MTFVAPDWDIRDELPGGEPALCVLLEDFYTRLYEDLLVGFFFLPFDQASLVAHQVDYIVARLGGDPTRYIGKPMRAAHAAHPILGAHFDRRHQLLAETLADHNVPAHVQRAWLDLDKALRPLIVRTGAQARDAILDPKNDKTPG
ncbi:MAG: group 1 truncated hemoglobin [Myxococcota bacterium]